MVKSVKEIQDGSRTLVELLLANSPRLPADLAYLSFLKTVRWENYSDSPLVFWEGFFISLDHSSARDSKDSTLQLL